MRRTKRDPATAQPSSHFEAMRDRQYNTQKRDYMNLVDFKGLAIAEPDQNRYRLMPVAVFRHKSGHDVAVNTRNLRRMYRLAKVDAGYEAASRHGPGPASVFLEIAKRPHEELCKAATQMRLWPRNKL